MNPLDNIEKIIVGNRWNKDRIIGEQLIANYRLVRTEVVTARKLALVFKKIEFQPPIKNERMRERFKEVAEELKLPN